MHLDLKAANQFEVDDAELANVFEQRNRSSKEYGPLFEGVFNPYIPSEGIIEKFGENTLKFSAVDPSYENPFDAASETIIEMINAFSGADLSKGFEFNLSDFTNQVDEQIEFKDPTIGQLPPTPQPSQQVVQTAAIPASGTLNQGLTNTENALLSDEEKQIRLRQRGLA